MTEEAELYASWIESLTEVDLANGMNECVGMLLTRSKRLEDALRKCEWSMPCETKLRQNDLFGAHEPTGCFHCPLCGRPSYGYHKPECELAAALK